MQWMTAGSGIIHQEMPKGDAQGGLWGFQLWANLPAARKMTEPRYRSISASQIPTVRPSEGVEVKVICGQFGGISGPVQDVFVEPQYLDVTLAKGASLVHPVPVGFTAFAYVINGSGLFDAHTEASAEGLISWGDGDGVEVRAHDQGLRFLLVSGKPLKEPIAWYGPIVMNTEGELEQAFEEYRNGTFIKHNI